MATINRATPNSRTYTVDGRIGTLYARGGKLATNVVEAVTSASIDLSTSEVSQLNLTLSDPGLVLLEQRLFQAGTTRDPGSHVEYRGLRFECSAVEVGDDGDGPVVVVEARSVVGQRLKRARGPVSGSKTSATDFARRLVTDVGGRFVGQPTAAKATVSRQKGETSWDTLARLADEVGFVVFESAGTVFFGKPTWLIGRDGSDVVALAWDPDGDVDNRLIGMPRCRSTADNAKKAATVSWQAFGTLGDDVRPGQRLQLTGVPGFEGRYLVTSVTIPLDDATPVSVEAATPINPVPQPPPAKTTKGAYGGSGGGSAAAGRGTASAFVQAALAQAGDRYIFGAEASVSDPDPTAFDCSELVQWAAGRAGVTFVDGSAAQIAACKSISVDQAIATRGALLWHPGHIAISLGNGRTIEAANSRVGVVSYSARGRFQRGGLIPGLAY